MSASVGADRDMATCAMASSTSMTVTTATATTTATTTITPDVTASGTDINTCTNTDIHAGAHTDTMVPNHSTNASTSSNGTNGVNRSAAARLGTVPLTQSSRDRSSSSLWGKQTEAQRIWKQFSVALAHPPPRHSHPGHAYTTRSIHDESDGESYTRSRNGNGDSDWNNAGNENTDDDAANVSSGSGRFLHGLQQLSESIDRIFFHDRRRDEEAECGDSTATTVTGGDNDDDGDVDDNLLRIKGTFGCERLEVESSNDVTATSAQSGSTFTMDGSDILLPSDDGPGQAPRRMLSPCSLDSDPEDDNHAEDIVAFPVGGTVVARDADSIMDQITVDSQSHCLRADRSLNLSNVYRAAFDRVGADTSMQHTPDVTNRSTQSGSVLNGRSRQSTFASFREISEICSTASMASRNPPIPSPQSLLSNPAATVPVSPLLSDPRHLGISMDQKSYDTSLLCTIEDAHDDHDDNLLPFLPDDDISSIHSSHTSVDSVVSVHLLVEWTQQLTTLLYGERVYHVCVLGKTDQQLRRTHQGTTAIFLALILFFAKASARTAGTALLYSSVCTWMAVHVPHSCLEENIAVAILGATAGIVQLGFTV